MLEFIDMWNVEESFRCGLWYCEISLQPNWFNQS